MTDCSVENCTKPSRIHKMCWGHHERVKRYGTPNAAAPIGLIHGWTPERRATVLNMWDAGNSGSVIAAAMGKGVTRNMIIGMVHRRKDKANVPRITGTSFAKTLTPEERELRSRIREAKRATMEARMLMPRIRIAPTPVFVRGPLPGSIPVNLFDRTGCAFPINDGGPFLFCNEPLTSVRPYCETHAQMMVKSVENVSLFPTLPTPNGLSVQG